MSQPFLILHVITALNVGGVQHQLSKVVSSYDLSSFSPSVCCLRHKGQIGEELDRKGIPVKVLGERDSSFDPFVLWRLYRLLRAGRVKILRAHKYHSALYGVLAGRMAKVPVIIPSFHLPQSTQRPKKRAMIRLLSRLSDRIVGVSQAVKESLVEGVGIDSSKVEVIHNGVDLTEFQNLPSREEARRRIGVPSGAWVIGGVGRMKPQKGFEFLLKAIPMMERDGLRDYQVLLVGDGEARAELQMEAREMGREDRVRFLGMRRDVPLLMRAMDCLAFPSLWEGFGTALAEAMAAGVPIVASDLPCVREIIPDESYGQLVPLRDPESLAQGILRIWSDGALRRATTEAAMDRAIREFSLSQVVRRYEELFRRIHDQKVNPIK